MKTAILLLLLSFSTNAFAECDSALTERMFKKMTMVNNRVENWTAVARKKLYKRNRLFPIRIFTKDRIRLSKLTYKKETYSLRDASICYDGVNFKLTGVRNNGSKRSFYISRRGTKAKDALVRLHDLKFNVKIYLRPSRLVD